jgi:hypothetical protein
LILFQNKILNTLFIQLNMNFQQKKANSEHFIQMAKLTKMYYWLNQSEMFKIINNKFLCDTKEKQRLIRTHTTPAFYRDYVIHSV